MTRVNITPVIQMILGPAMAQVKTKEDLDALIQALEEMPEDAMPSGEEMAEIAENMYKKSTDKAVSP